MVRVVTSMELQAEADRLEKVKTECVNYMKETLPGIFDLKELYYDAHLELHHKASMYRDLNSYAELPEFKHVCIPTGAYCAHIEEVMTNIMDSMPPLPNLDHEFRRKDKMARHLFERKKDHAEWSCRLRAMQTDCAINSIKAEIQGINDELKEVEKRIETMRQIKKRRVS